MPISARSIEHGVTEPSTPQIAPLAPGELAIRLRLVPPIVPQADGEKSKPFFAACAATPCSGPTEKLVFLAYAALSGPTGATWAVKRGRVHFFARQTKVAAIAECTVRTVHKMTMRLLKAGRLRCVMSGRGRIPHAFVVVPGGWNSQFRPERGAGLNPVDRNVVPVNRASFKRRAANATRLKERVTNQPLAKKAASDVPSQTEQTKPVAPPPLSLVQPMPNENRLKQFWISAKERYGLKPLKQQTAILEPEPTPERRAAALALFAAVDAGIDEAAEVAMLEKMHAAISKRRGGSDRGWCPYCESGRLVGGSCEMCGFDDGSEPRPSADCNAGGDA